MRRRRSPRPRAAAPISRLHPVPQRGGDDRPARRRLRHRLVVLRPRRRADRPRRPLHRRHRRGRRAAGATVVHDRRRSTPATASGHGKGNVLWAIARRQPRRLRRVVRRRRHDVHAGLGRAPARRRCSTTTPSRSSRPATTARRRSAAAAAPPSSSPARCCRCSSPSSPACTSRCRASSPAAATVIEQIPFVEGWGVEIAHARSTSPSASAPARIAQVDVGVRLHRHRTCTSSSVQAAEVMATLLGRVRARRRCRPSRR